MSWTRPKIKPDAGFCGFSALMMPRPAAKSTHIALPCSEPAMGACATKPGDLKGEAPLVVEDAAEKSKADAVVPVPVPAEADAADAGRRRSLSDLLKQDAETSDDAGGEADQEADKAVAAEPASAVGDDAGGAAMGEEDQSSQEAPVVQASVAAAAEQQDGTVQELKVGPSGDGDAAQEAEEEKRVDPESVQVVAADTAAAAADPSAEDSKPATAADADGASA